MSTSTILAIRVHRYGGPEQLQLEQIARPEPQADEVLVRVYAVSFSNRPSTQLLQSLAQLIEEEHINVALGRTFPLHEVRQAHELSQTGHGRGRIVLHIAG